MTMTKLIAVETRLYLRDWMLVVWGIAFPVLLLVILGSIPSFREASEDFGGRRVIDVYVPVLIAFVLAMLAVSALPSVLASYRERGVLRRLATTPVGPARLLAAQLAVNAAIVAATLVLILVVARVAFGVPLPDQALGFGISLVLAAAALLAIGVFIAAVAPSARAATTIGAALWFPLMFLAGLWVPRDVMPDALRQASDLSPLGAAVGALQASAEGDWPRLLHLAVLAACAAGFGAAASRLFKWE
jgi:ABC-2 type transport system permease protein